MADEKMSETAATIETNAAASPEKKLRKPRSPKAATEKATSKIAAVSAQPTARKASSKGGVKSAPKNSLKVSSVPHAVVKNAATKAEDAAASNFLADDIGDLIKLEEENKQLRKQLSEKLRAENADLRKRLGLG